MCMLGAASETCKPTYGSGRQPAGFEPGFEPWLRPRSVLDSFILYSSAPRLGGAVEHMARGHSVSILSKPVYVAFCLKRVTTKSSTALFHVLVGRPEVRVTLSHLQGPKP